MTAEPVPIAFVDTNVLVYAFDRQAGSRHDLARLLLADLWASGAGALSTQVLQEFYATTTRKLAQPLSRGAAREVVEAYRRWPVLTIGPSDIVAASELEERHSLSFWDALIVVAAQRSGAVRLLSEDMQAGRRFAGLVVENPFG